MNKTLKITLIVVAVVITLAYLFVQWANQSANVEALKQYREEERKKEIADSLKKVEEDKQNAQKTELEAKKEAEIQQKTEADLILVAEETFKKLQFSAIEDKKARPAKLDKGALLFEDWIVTPKSNGNYVLAVSKEDVEHFVAELEVESEGCGVGIVFNYEDLPNKSWKSDRVYIGKWYLESQMGEKLDKKRLEEIPEVKGKEFLTKLIMRFEKKGKTFKTTLNGKVISEEKITAYGNEKGKVGIYVHYYNESNFNRSAKAQINYFKLWKW